MALAAAQQQHTKSAPVLSTRPQESPAIAAHILQRTTLPHAVSTASLHRISAVEAARAAPVRKKKKAK